jgi:hypothetical protein
VPDRILGVSDVTSVPVALLVGLGAIVGIAGHLAGSRRTVVAGLAILFVSTALLIVVGYVAYRDDGRDPRPCDAPAGC